MDSMLILAMMRLDEEKVLTLVKNNLDRGYSSLDIIEEVREGMTRVGELYQKGKYFLGDLMLCADIFREASNMIKINNIPPPLDYYSPVVIGTVKNDIHDIGKNILAQFLVCQGYNIVDLGVDVSPGTFAKAIMENSSNILCMSGLLTISYDSMKLTIEELEKHNIRNKISVIIGGLVNEEVCKYVGADYWTRDCSEGVNLCDKLLNSKKSILIS